MQEYLRSGVKGKGKGCRESGREKLLIHIILKKMGVKITIMGENRNLPFKTTMLPHNPWAKVGISVVCPIKLGLLLIWKPYSWVISLQPITKKLDEMFGIIKN